MIFIDFNCYIITKKHLVYNIPDIIPAGGTLKIKTSDYDRLFGLGFCGVTITIFLDGDNNIDGQATKSGLGAIATSRLSFSPQRRPYCVDCRGQKSVTLQGRYAS